MRRTTLSLCLLGAIFLVVQASAQAQMTYNAASPLGTANSFNAFIFNEARAPGGHADGCVAVGGTFTMAYTTVLGGWKGAAGNKSNIGIYAGALAVTGSTQVNGSADVYTNSITGAGNLIMNGGALYSGAGTIDTSLFASQLSYSQYQSTHLGDLTAAAINTSDKNNWSLDANNSTEYGNLKVFTIAGSQLSSNVTLSVNNLLPNQTLAINVTGAVPHFGVTVNNAAGSQIVWNFLVTSTSDGKGGYKNSVNIDKRSLTGTVLAPNAAVNQSANIDGILIASHWSATGSPEVHYTPTTTFQGDLSQVSPLAATPEPGAVGLLIGLGCSVAVFTRRRGKKRSQGL